MPPSLRSHPRSVLASLAFTCASATALVAQSGAPPLPGAEAAAAIVKMATPKGYVPPRTPWGDPDISGVFTTKDEANTPFEQPAEWAGRTMTDITPEEFEAAIAKRQQDAVESAPFAGGGEPEQGVAIAVPIHWFDNLAARDSRPWFVIEPDGKVPPLSEEGTRRRKPRRGPNGGGRDSYTDRSLNDRCVAMTFRQPTIYGNSYQIIQTPDHVVIRREQIHEARIVRLRSRAHRDPRLRTYEGDPVGYWDGNTLVVESTNYAPNVPYRPGVGFGGGEIAPGPRARVIERFTRTSRAKVEWTVTHDDPDTWVRPWSYSYPLTEDETQPIFEYACHEGNFGIANILSAGRAAEKKAP
ncbi:MAG: hypothetical protein AB7S39_23725 [Gemmatimonadales bacterium]